jgi:hypothetical protein
MASRRSIVALVISCVALSVSAAQAQSLKFFKNHIITGDYAVAGVALRGTSGTGIIDMSGAGIPANADILSVYLYWQTVIGQSDPVNVGMLGATFHGHSLDVVIDGVTQSIAKAVNPTGTAPCNAAGDSTGGAYGIRRAVTYRADVHRFLDQDPTTGKLLVNTTHEIHLPSSGGDVNQVPSVAGASLVVIYRDPSKPLRAVVIYDGGLTVDSHTPNVTVTVSGYYQPATEPDANVTMIVADGQSLPEKFIVNSIPFLTINPFNGPNWENTTFPISASTLGTGPSTSLRVTGIGSPFDCVSPVVAVLATNVKDTDEDGLIDIWESSATPLPDPNGGTLPNLKAMGADPLVQDVFVEIGYMTTTGYHNLEQTVPAHSHMPDRAVLESVATAFHNAGPRRSRTGAEITGPINIHFDVGQLYQLNLPTLEQCAATWQPTCAIIRGSAGVRGGDSIPETTGCRTDSAGNTTCGEDDFRNFPGTVGWKSGFNLLKNEPLNFVVTPGGPSLEQQCLASPTCQRRFDRNRRNIFRYVLFAHALGLVRVDAAGNPILDSTGAKMPKNTSGIADGGGVGGGDLMVTLGLWDNYKGSVFMNTTTLLHELGHTMGLRHGGGPPVRLTSGDYVGQPNCKPNYVSIMNYMFQVSGVTEPGGVVKADFSRQQLGPLNEGSLSEDLSGQPGWNAMAYKTSWYAPLASVSGVSGPSTRHCDGSFVTTGESLVRINGDASGRNDWNSDGDTSDAGLSQDVNFNSVLNDGVSNRLAFDGYNDFEHLDLRQVGTRRNAGSERIDGCLSLDIGFGDIGFGDIGFGDIGFGDIGFGDIGFGDIGFGDIGFGDIGFGDIGFGDIGFGDIGFGDIGIGGGGSQEDINFDIASSPELNAPNSLVATSFTKVIRLVWAAPHVGTVTGYDVYRAVGSTITPSSEVVHLGTLFPTTTQTRFDDDTPAIGVTYTYFVVGQLAGGGTTGASNFATSSR